DDERHLTETGQVLGLEVEHRDAMPVDARIDVDHQLAAASLGLHRGDPFGGFGLVELDPEPGGRFDDLRDGFVAGLGCHGSPPPAAWPRSVVAVPAGLGPYLASS